MSIVAMATKQENFYNFSIFYSLSVADLHSKILNMRPHPLAPIIFIFIQFSTKFGPKIGWRSPLWLAPHPPSENFLSWIRHCIHLIYYFS